MGGVFAAPVGRQGCAYPTSALDALWIGVPRADLGTYPKQSISDNTTSRHDPNGLCVIVRRGTGNAIISTMKIT